MSADSWATCPRCKAKGEIGIRGQEFREDYELGLNDPDAWGEDEQDQAPCVILNYTGKCQSCGLKVEIHERFPVTWEQPKNEPTGFIVRKAWRYIPAGWFVRAKPSGRWYEVLSTRVMHSGLQLVKLGWAESGSPLEVETQRPREDVVDCRRGSLAPSSVQAALEALGPGVEILEDGQ
jgi:hypothetical protein